MKSSVLVVLALLLLSCSRPEHLARGPIELGLEPEVVRFEAPLTSTGPGWEICFEFRIPGDSHVAERIEVRLVDAGGVRHSLSESRLDRRGESVVCRLGKTGAVEPIVGAELSSPVPIVLRGLRGGPTP